MLLAKNWWVFILRGVLAVIFGIAALFFPTAAFLSLVLVFGIFALIDGVFTVAAAFIADVKTENWWWLIFSGAIGIIIGVLTIWQPFAMGLAWIFVIAVWAIMTGIFEIFTAVRLRKLIEREWMMIVSGLLSVAFGVLAAVFPSSGAFAVGFIVGIYALMYGVLNFMFAFRLRKFLSDS